MSARERRAGLRDFREVAKKHQRDREAQRAADLRRRTEVDGELRALDDGRLL